MSMSLRDEHIKEALKHYENIEIKSFLEIKEEETSFSKTHKDKMKALFEKEKEKTFYSSKFVKKISVFAAAMCITVIALSVFVNQKIFVYNNKPVNSNSTNQNEGVEKSNYTKDNLTRNIDSYNLKVDIVIDNKLMYYIDEKSKLIEYNMEKKTTNILGDAKILIGNIEENIYWSNTNEYKKTDIYYMDTKTRKTEVIHSFVEDYNNMVILEGKIIIMKNNGNIEEVELN